VGKDVATIQIFPWMAYSCSVGARINIKAIGASVGQCATIDRILGDDRVVARVDGYTKAMGVKGEVILDLQPKGVVPTAGPGYTRGQKLLVLNVTKTMQKLVDATVMSWEGSIDFQQGSRHMVSLKEPGAKTGIQAWPSLNVFNHVAVPSGMTAALYEESRNKMCEFLAASQDTVEDAITGNSLPIKDQLIFMAAVIVKDGCQPPAYMSCGDVPGLVEQLAVESPDRIHGSHSAQPVLCRAGPGTGKTWMIKQTLFLLATRLGGDGAGEGVRLVPFVVYVQRVVRLLSELGEEPASLLANPEGMMRWYISHEFADNKDFLTMLLLAYDLRALVILVDGVDEAAGMRDLVEAFVHYELVTSGNRLVVTSRPEELEMTLTAHQLTALVILVDGVDEAAGMRDIVEAFVHYELVTSGNRLVVTSRPEGVDLEDYKVCVTTITRQPTIVTLRPSPRLRNRPCTCRDYIERRFPRITSPFLACRLLPLLSRRRAIRSALR